MPRRAILGHGGGRSRHTGCWRAPAPPRQRRVRCGGCAAHVAPQEQAGLGTGHGVQGSRPPPAQQPPLVPPRPLRKVQPLAALTVRFPFASWSHHKSPSQVASAGVGRGPDRTRRLRSKVFWRPPRRFSDLRGRGKPGSHAARVPAPSFPGTAAARSPVRSRIPFRCVRPPVAARSAIFRTGEP